MIALLLLAQGCSLTASPPAPEPVVDVAPTAPPSAPDPELGKRVWDGLGSTQNQCRGYDYFPDGGLRIFACHVATHLDYEGLVAAYGGFPFVRGPHTMADLDLDETGQFGHYNPAFVRWLGATFLPAVDDAGFRERTQPLYDANVRPLARTMEVVHRKLGTDGDCAAQEDRWYRSAMNEVHNFDAHEPPEAYYERWYGFLSAEFCRKARKDGIYLEYVAVPDDYDGNVVKTVVGWWLRRGIDGTADLWHTQLTKLLEAYDRDWLASLSAPVEVERDD